MRCLKCGAETLASRERCGSCGAIVGQRPAVAAGVLTPPPAVDDAASETTLAADSLTYLAAPADAGKRPVPSSDEPDAQTRLAPAVDTTDGETRLAALDGEAILTPMPSSDPRTRQGGSDGRSARAGNSGVSTPVASDNEGPLTIGQAFGPRYHIIRLLGAGGMGAVYQAWDAELGVAVAIKVIRPEITKNPTLSAEVERRFKRELLLARQVTHQNVVRIHDLGQIDGIKYITMPYVAGTDLGTILKEDKKLTIPELLRVARSIVSGLVAAHAAGVVHRDLKPANIMIDNEGNALIMDFGIARSTGGPGPSATPTNIAALPTNLRLSAVQEATVMGSVVGTIEYMAPEQAKGQVVDQRADIYSLGLILYDVLTGQRRAEHAASAIDELKGRLQQAPPTVKSVMRDVPPAVDAIISRCLEPDPGKRFQTTVELKAELDRLDDNGQPIKIRKVVGLGVVAALIVAAVSAVAWTWWSGGRTIVEAPKQAISIVIADFENHTNERVFQGTLENAMSIALEGASFITAYRRDEAHRDLEQIKPGARLDEAGARLLSARQGIKVVLTGSIEQKGSGYSIAVKAIDPAAEEPLATASERASSKDDVLRAIGLLASKIRGGLGDETPAAERRAAAETVTAASLEALQNYTRGQELQINSKYEESIEYYKRAIALDPKFGRAFSSWAVSAFALGRRDEAEGLYKQAFALMDRMTEREKYRIYGTYYLTIARNYEQAKDNYTTLLDKYPSDRAARTNLAYSYFAMLDFAHALEENRRAMDIYRGSFKLWSNHALYAMYAGDFKTAEEEAANVLEQSPGAYRAYLPRAMAALARGDATSAQQAYEAMAQTGRQGASLAAIGSADLLMYQGLYADAERILKAGILEDEKLKSPAAMAAKTIALAEAQIGQGQPKAAAGSVRKALDLSRDEPIVVSAARLFVSTGNTADASLLATELDKRLLPQPRAYAKIIEGEIHGRAAKPAEAVEAFQASQKLADLWLTRFSLGVAYVEAKHYPEGLRELEAAEKRRGEATAIFLNDVPSFRYLGTLSYWLARAQEGIGQKPLSIDNYKKFLALRSPNSKDPLVTDARARLK
jgi:tetratricopeptide (TPR) repeat protein/tRNA A-37 threonylcarbamoyl transferase component Bud32